MTYMTYISSPHVFSPAPALHDVSHVSHAKVMTYMTYMTYARQAARM